MQRKNVQLLTQCAVVPWRKLGRTNGASGTILGNFKEGLQMGQLGMQCDTITRFGSPEPFFWKRNQCDEQLSGDVTLISVYVRCVVIWCTAQVAAWRALYYFVVCFGGTADDGAAGLVLNDGSYVIGRFAVSCQRTAYRLNVHCILAYSQARAEFIR